MFLPYGDAPNHQGFLPWVTWTLIVVNVLVYLGITLPLSLMSDPGPWQDFIGAFAFVPAHPEVVDVFTAIFIHAGLLHLVGNMLFLWIFGDNVEHRLGRAGFLVAYLLCGALATAAHVLIDATSTVPLVGASGAISGVLGLYFVFFPRNVVRVLVLLPFYVETWLVPARVVLAFFLVVDNLLPVLVSDTSEVAYGAHLGGFVAGALMALAGSRIWERARLQWEDRQRHGGLVGMREALVRKDVSRGLELLQAHGVELSDELEADECVTLAAWLDRAGQPRAADTLLRRSLGRVGEPRARARVLLALGLLRSREGQAVAAAQALRSAMDLDADQAVLARAEQALAALGRRPR